MHKNNLLFYFYLALIVWLPLPYGSNRPWAWSFFELVVFVLTFLVVLPRKQADNSATRLTAIPFTPVLLCLLFALTIALRMLLEWLSILPGIGQFDLNAQWVHFRTTLAYAAFMFLTLALVNSMERLKLLASVVVAIGVFQAAFGSFMTLSGAEYGFFTKKLGYEGTATGTFWNRNHFANYLNLCLAIGTGLLLSQLYSSKAKNSRERMRRLLTTLLGDKLRIRLGLAIMVIALVLTKSRMGNTAFFISLFFTAILWLALTRNFTRGSMLLLASLLIIDSLIVGSWFGFDKVKERVESTTFTQETRDEVNRDILPIIERYWLFGTGAGTFYTVFPQYRSEDVNLYYDHAHNDYGEFMVEHGVLGILPLVLLVILAFYHALKTLFDRKQTLLKAFSFSVIMGLTASFIHATVEFNLQIPANAVMTLLLISLAWVIHYLPSRSRKRFEP